MDSDLTIIAVAVVGGIVFLKATESQFKNAINPHSQENQDRGSDWSDIAGISHDSQYYDDATSYFSWISAANSINPYGIVTNTIVDWWAT